MTNTSETIGQPIQAAALSTEWKHAYWFARHFSGVMDSVNFANIVGKASVEVPEARRYAFDEDMRLAAEKELGVRVALAPNPSIPTLS